ncbi:MAG TPA: DUF1631 family protein [Pseudomonas xinjiangensis]|uniref:DUF1631 family protein n=2 Tax=root TaxID=1 RepID=A0A7V1FRK5_9GAMM|nr:DUF1631 family protein [Halopseudomonas xinjiangensis]HEC48577.1 DUF1631 family protein [Halopseudomonas xinjiangensis]
MEKRQFLRQAASIDGAFSVGPGTSFGCVISDYSQGGMLIKLNGARQSGAIKSLLEQTRNLGMVSFQLPGRRVVVDVTVVHISKQGLGLRLSHMTPHFVIDMQQAVGLIPTAKAAANESSVAGKALLDSASKIKLIQENNSRIAQFLDNHLPAFFEALKSALLDEADRQRSQTAQQPFFDTLALLRKQQPDIGSAIKARIFLDATDVANNRYVEDVQAGKNRGDRPALSLIEKNEFEDWLVIRKAISKAEIIQREYLIELQLRFDAAFGQPGASQCYNPYSPAAVSYAFAEAAKNLRMTGKVQMVAFKVLYEVVLARMDLAYGQLNRLFINAGVLPDIDVAQFLTAQTLQQRRDTNVAQAPQASAPQSGGPGASDPAQAPAGPNTTDRTSSIPAVQATDPKRTSTAFNTATRLWAAHKKVVSGDSSQLGALDSGPAQASVVNDSTLHGLHALQHRLLQGSNGLNRPGALKNQLMRSSDPDTPLSEFEQDSADMIENLFDNIVRGPTVVDELREELRKLEVPLLRVMLKDPNLFTAEFHPARQAVNHLALLSDRNSLHSSSNKAAILKSIASILESSDDQGFNKALLILDQLVAKEKHLVDRNLMRVTEACEGQQRIRQASHLVELELIKRLVSPPVPQPLIDLIEHGWKDLMMLCLFREGDDSRSWDLTLEIIDQLIARIVPNADTRVERLLKTDALSRLVSKGLSKVHDVAGNHHAIVSSLEQLIDGTAPAAPLVAYQSTPEHIRAEANQVNIANETDKAAQRWLKRAKSLKKGQWLENLAQPAFPSLYQLAWVADDFNLYVFANQHGMKVAELSLQEVASRLQKGTLVICDQAALPAVEQGLDTLVQRIYEKLAFDASHDQLTGLRTRKEFSNCLAQSVAKARETQCRHTLIFIDVLQFKLINNTCGYEAGDRLLCDLSMRLKNFVDDAAVVGRIGAAEFALLVPMDVEQDGYILASELKADIEARRFQHGDQSFVIQTVVALVGFDHTNERVMELLRSVEAAAEICKKSGHKEIQVVFPGDTRLEERDEVMSWVTRINRALDEDNLKIRCQKIAPVGTNSSALMHYEVLLTVIDENGEHLPPADFIKAAEEFNRMGAVDRWVIENVLRWMQDNLQDLKYFGGFSINLSGHSLNDESFLDFIFDALVRYQVPREKLIFEITETIAVANLEDAADFINEMRGIGCRFSLDDFGVGQSSFSYLKRLPVDFIKIDGSFVTNIATDAIDYALVRSITEMGHFLNKKIIAEYVSSEDILDAVTEIGVDYAQGYQLGEQVMIDDLTLGPSAAR